MDQKQQQIIMNNIDKILEKRNIKRSSLEREIRVSPGYLSRLTKSHSDSNAQKMSYELLKKIADALKVSMDYLMLNVIENTSDEMTLIDFIESIFSMTLESKLSWNTFTLEQINRIDDPDEFDKLGPVSKRAFETGEYDPEGRSFEYCWIGWLSIKDGKQINDILYTKANLIDNFYYAHIEKIESTLYLYRVEYSDQEDQHKLDNVIEAYLVSRDDTHYLCNSVEWNEFISSKLVDLYQIARDSSSATRLSDGARKILNLFNAD